MGFQVVCPTMRFMFSASIRGSVSFERAMQTTLLKSSTSAVFGGGPLLRSQGGKCSCAPHLSPGTVGSYTTVLGELRSFACL